MSLRPSIYRVTLNDVEAITDAMVEGTRLIPRNELLCRDVESHALRAWFKLGATQQITSTLQGETDPKETEVKLLLKPGDVSAIKLVSTDGELAGRAIWRYEFKKEDRGKHINDFYQNFYHHPEAKAPEGLKLGLKKEFEEKIIKLHAAHEPDGEHLVLMELMTVVKFRRLGVATKLVTWGLEQADRMGIPLYLAASPDGYPVYKKLGYQERDRLSIALEDYGGEGTHYHVAMIRDAAKKD